MTNIAIMGHGTVGSGVAEVLLKNDKHISLKTKDEINIKYILFIIIILFRNQGSG